MSSIDYINALAARGVELWTQDGKLQYKAPKDVVTPQLLAELKQHKAVLIDLLTQFAGTAGTYPLSYSQRSLWSLHQLQPASAAYNVTYAAALSDALEPALLARCVDYLIARHPILRTRYAVVEGQPMQQVDTRPSTQLAQERLHGADAPAILRWVEQEANRPFDLGVSPLRLKLLLNEAAPAGAPRHVLLLNVHHIAADFWSLEIMVNELRTLYAQARQGQALKLAPLTLQYKDHVQREAQRLQGAEGQALAAFWDDELRGGLPPLQLATDSMRPPVKTENGRVYTQSLGAALTQSVKQLARSLNTTPYTLLLGVYQLFLFLHTGQTRLAIGAPTAGRDMPGTEAVLGHFVNTVVLNCELQPHQRFTALVEATRSMMGRVLDHQDYPFPLLVERLRPARDPSRSPLFQVMFNWNQVRSAAPDEAADAEALFGAAVVASSTGTRGATHDVTLNIQDSGTEYATAWTYNTDLFEPATVQRFAARYAELVAQVLSDPAQPLAAYRCLAAPARAAQLEDVARGAGRAEDGAVMVQSILASARQHPALPAWHLPASCLALGPLADAVSALAARWRRAGLAPGQACAVQVDSAPELALVLLTLMALDAAVLPPVPSDAVAAWTVQRRPGAGWADWQPAALELVPGTVPARAPTEALSATQLAGFCNGAAHGLSLAPGVRLVLPQGTPPYLGAALLVAALACGAEVTVPAAPALAALAGDDSASAATAAQALSAALSEARAHALALPALLLPRVAPAALQALQTVLTYGEQAHPLLALAGLQPGPALRHLPQHALQALAGPAVFEPLDNAAGARWRLLQPYGVCPAPLLLTPTHDVADEHQAAQLHWLVRPAPGGVPRPASGFDNLADLGARLQGCSVVSTPLTLVRRAGEMLAQDVRGALAMHRAVPVSLGLVEAALARLAEVAEVACVLRQVDDAPALVAYVRPRAAAEDAAALERALRKGLKPLLPESMHPDRLVCVPALPLTAQGELDPARLPAPPRVGAGRRAASGEVELKLAALWGEVLGHPAVGADDDFFQLGGDSILAAVIVSRAATDGLYLRPRDLFEHTTIAALAEVVSSTPHLQAEQGPVLGEAPLGPAAAWFFERVEVDRSHFNQALLLQMREAPAPALVEQALRLLARQHDALRSRFVERDGDWRQCFDDEATAVEAAWAVVDVAAPGGGVDEARWQAAVAAAQAGLDIERGPLWAVRWLAASTPAQSRLLIVVHHLLVDGVSWSVLLQDLGALLHSLQAGEAPRLPLKTTSAKDWASVWAARVNSEALATEREYWSGFAAQVRRGLTEPGGLVLLRHGGTRPAAVQVEPQRGSCLVTLDAETTDAFRQRAHLAYDTDADDLLAAALHAGLYAWTGSPRLLLDMEHHGRDALPAQADLGRSVGWFTSLYPVLLAAPSRQGPAALIKAVKQQLREVPGRGASFGALRYLREARHSAITRELAALPASPVLFTYLGQLDAIATADGPFTGLVAPAPGIRSARQPGTHLMDICAYITQDRLTLECSFSGGSAVDDSVGCAMKHIAHALTELVRHCCSADAGGLTPSDVPALGLDQQGLDALLDEVAALDR